MLLSHLINEKTCNVSLIFLDGLLLITSILLQTRRAEVKVAVSMVDQNVPFEVNDHFSPLLKECFKDFPTAQGLKEVPITKFT